MNTHLSKKRLVVMVTGLSLGTFVMASPVQAATQIVNGDIAYSAPNDDPQNPGPYEVDIYTVKPDGSNKTNLTPDATGNSFLPKYSPDGTQISYTDTASGNATINKMNADGTGKTDISGDGGQSAYSQESDWGPNNKIVFQRTDGDRNAWVMNPDGTNQVNLTNQSGTGLNPQHIIWNADGSKVFFNRGSGADLYSINADGTGLTQVGSVQAWPMNFSRDGLKVLYTFGDSGILYQANSDFSNPVQMYQCDYQAFAAGNICVASATFSPDNLKIAMVAFRVVDPNDLNSFQVGLFVANADGSNAQLVSAQSLSAFGDISGVSWQAVTQNIPDPTPTPTPTPGGNGSGSGTGLTQAAVNPALDPVTELPKAGNGGMAGAYAGAVAAYGAYQIAKRRKRWDIQRRAVSAGIQ